jgi:hypothetical protein
VEEILRRKGLTPNQRARQFLPFDALKGLQEELRRREENYGKEIKREISEEKEEKISNIMQQLEIGSMVRAEYYKNGYYEIVYGAVKKLSTVYHFIVIEDTKINFTNLYDLELLFE